MSQNDPAHHDAAHAEAAPNDAAHHEPAGAFDPYSPATPAPTATAQAVAEPPLGAPTQGQEEAHSGLLRAAGLQFLAAVGIAVVAAGFGLAATDGGIVWTGGYLFAGLLLFRAVRTYIAAHRAGARLKLLTWLVVIVAAVIGLGAVGVSVNALAKADAAKPGASDPGPDQVNSCWHQKDDDHLYHVKCSSTEAQFKATSEVTDPADCADLYLEGRKGYYLCLSDM